MGGGGKDTSMERVGGQRWQEKVDWNRQGWEATGSRGSWGKLVPYDFF
jgi:hypothetical protein